MNKIVILILLLVTPRAVPGENHLDSMPVYLPVPAFLCGFGLAGAERVPPQLPPQIPYARSGFAEGEKTPTSEVFKILFQSRNL